MDSELRLLREPQYDVLILGAGFSGLGMAVALLKANRRSFVILERADDIGGAWRDNSYPGCACDIPSALYSFSFAQNPRWSRAFPPQPEIQAYLKAVCDEGGVSPYVRLGKRATRLDFDDQAAMWRVEAADGDVFTARVVVSGMGGLSNPAWPNIEGAETFKGNSFHSAQWDHAYDLTGKSVAVIGTGASAIQFTPVIAGQVASLRLFQRTPPWIIPKRDRPIPEWLRRLFAAFPPAQRLARAKAYWRAELTAVGFLRHTGLLKRAQAWALRHLEASIPSAELRQALTPDYVLGCKRVLISNDYYPTLTRDNVTLITSPIARITETGLTTADGRDHRVDCIIYGTGFCATQPMKDVDILGAGGRSLANDWARGAEAFLGVTVAGYPNLFLLMGPNTGLGHNSMIYMIESQIRYVMNALKLMDRTDSSTMDTRQPVQAAFNDALQRRISRTVWNTGGCHSWYLTADGRNTMLWPGFSFDYRRRTRWVDPGAYELQPMPKVEPVVRN